MKKVIFFGSTGDVLHQMYKDLELEEDILYKRGILNLNSRLLTFIFTIFFSKKINNYIKIPFKKLWFKYFIPRDIVIAPSPIFIFTKDNFRYLEQGYAKYLKKIYPNCRIILLFLDVHGLRGYDFKLLNNLYDDAFVFDEKEAKKYSISYYPLCYSKSQFDLSKKIYDICFIGQDKGRINKINKIYQQAKSIGLNMKVIICGSDNKDNVTKYPDFEFIDSISYNATMKYISQSKFNLEVCLNDTTSISIRLYEAIMFNQGLITNNLYVKNSPYFDNSYVYIIDLENIDLSFVKNFKEVDSPKLKEKINPLRFIEYIKNKQEEQ